MKSGRFVEVLLFASGLGLSLITNLFTGDDEVLNFYQANRKEVLLAGAGLILLSVILSLKSASGGGESESDKGVPLSKVLSSAISSTISWIFYGALIGFVLFHLLGLVNQINGVNIPTDYFTAIATTFVGFIVGYRFWYLGFDEFFGMITGAIIGYSASYYFPLDISFNFLPSFLIQDAIIASAIVGGAIGFFTGIFKPTFLKKRNDKRAASQKEIEDFELIEARMLKHDYKVVSSNLLEKLVGMQLSTSDAPEAEKEELMKDVKKASKKMRHSTTMMDMFGDNPYKSPMPPFAIFNSKGEEIHRFSSLSALKKFSETL